MPTVFAIVAVNGGNPSRTRMGKDASVPAPTTTFRPPARKPAPPTAAPRRSGAISISTLASSSPGSQDVPEAFKASKSALDAG